MSLGTIEVRGLDKGSLRELSRQAKRAGLTPGQYVKNLLEEQLEILRDAQEKTFAEITGPGVTSGLDDAELDRLVEEARNRHHRRMRRKG